MKTVISSPQVKNIIGSKKEAQLYSYIITFDNQVKVILITNVNLRLWTLPKNTLLWVFFKFFVSLSMFFNNFRF